MFRCGICVDAPSYANPFSRRLARGSACGDQLRRGRTNVAISGVVRWCPLAIEQRRNSRPRAPAITLSGAFTDAIAVSDALAGHGHGGGYRDGVAEPGPLQRPADYRYREL